MTRYPLIVLAALGTIACGKSVRERDPCLGSSVYISVPDALPKLADDAPIVFAAGGSVDVRGHAAEDVGVTFTVDGPFALEATGTEARVSSTGPGSGVLRLRDGCGNEDERKLVAGETRLAILAPRLQYGLAPPAEVVAGGIGILRGGEMRLEVTRYDASGTQLLLGHGGDDLVASGPIEVEHEEGHVYIVRADDRAGDGVVTAPDGTRFEIPVVDEVARLELWSWGESRPLVGSEVLEGGALLGVVSRDAEGRALAMGAPWPLESWSDAEAVATALPLPDLESVSVDAKAPGEATITIRRGGLEREVRVRIMPDAEAGRSAVPVLE